MTVRRFPAVVHRNNGWVEEVWAVLEGNRVRFDPPLTLGPQESVHLPAVLLQAAAEEPPLA